MAVKGTEGCFSAFRRSTGFLDTLTCFEDLCHSADVNPTGDEVFSQLQAKLQTSDSRILWQLLDKRQSQQEYYNSNNERACSGKQVLIVGAGPCGLRMAIECALLGAKVTVIDMRSYITRNNVLHLWPFLLEDIKGIGGKIFNPKFCVGGINHVSIKCLQLMMLKISLMLGVKVYTPVTFQKIIQPNQTRGWHVSVSPEDHLIHQMDFEFIIAASGLTNTLPDITKKTTRGKLAIAITANFINGKTKADAMVQEIGGLSFLFKQEFFKDLKDKTGAELENIVYFKDDSHYFVMTVKKSSLIKTGVLKQDNLDARILLSKENIDHEHLKTLTRDIAITSTRGELPCDQFSLNHYGKEDIAIFDFTSIAACQHACFVKEELGHTLVQCTVGDSLLQPFWPTGTGCARGFLSVFDAAWMVRSWCIDDSQADSNTESKLSIIAERENIYTMLSYTRPDGNARVISKYTIDPRTRYKRINSALTPDQVKKLYIQHQSTFKETEHNPDCPHTFNTKLDMDRGDNEMCVENEELVSDGQICAESSGGYLLAQNVKDDSLGVGNMNHNLDFQKDYNLSVDDKNNGHGKMNMQDSSDDTLESLNMNYDPDFEFDAKRMKVDSLDTKDNPTGEKNDNIETTQNDQNSCKSVSENTTLEKSCKETIIKENLDTGTCIVPVSEEKKVIENNTLNIRLDELKAGDSELKLDNKLSDDHCTDSTISEYFDAENDKAMSLCRATNCDNIEIKSVMKHVLLLEQGLGSLPDKQCNQSFGEELDNMICDDIVEGVELELYEPETKTVTDPLKVQSEIIANTSCTLQDGILTNINLKHSMNLDIELSLDTDNDQLSMDFMLSATKLKTGDALKYANIDEMRNENWMKNPEISCEQVSQYNADISKLINVTKITVMPAEENDRIDLSHVISTDALIHKNTDNLIRENDGNNSDASDDSYCSTHEDFNSDADSVCSVYLTDECDENMMDFGNRTDHDDADAVVECVRNPVQYRASLQFFRSLVETHMQIQTPV